MASNAIVSRVQDFLKQYPPFSYLNPSELKPIATSVHVQYYGKGKFLFQENDLPHSFIFVLQKGRIEIAKRIGDSTQLIDICDEGDVFGIRAALNNLPYIGSAIASEDSLVYAIPNATFLQLLEANASVALFFASGLAAGMPVVREGTTNQENRASDLQIFGQEQVPKFMTQEDILIVKPTEEVITCDQSASIASAAQLMKTHRIGSVIIVDANRHPIGIVTDTDFTRKVVAKHIDSTLPISSIMSSPVFTIEPNASISQYILRMMKYKVKHLVVTEDGSHQSALLGIASEHDVLLMHGNDPAILVKRMLKAKTIDALAKIRDRGEHLIVTYLKQEVSIEFITDIMTEINDALIHRAIEFALERLEKEGWGKAPLPFCWLSLGSEGRGEQLLRTDQDNAIVYEDPSEEHRVQVAAYFLKLGEYVVEILLRCGFSLCKGEIMASNPKWTQSLSTWKSYFRKWIDVPEPMALMNGAIFFDLRATYGAANLAEELDQFILSHIQETRNLFLYQLAKNSLNNPPPLSFFKNFVVEKSGENKDLFDIKKRSMMPLADAARLLTLAEGIAGTKNTFKRFEYLSRTIPERAELFKEAAMAYELFISTRASNGFKNGDSGRYIQPNDLNRIKRQTLRYAFKTIEQVQLYVKHRYGLNFQ